MEQLLVSIEDAAKALSLSPWTLRAWATQGRLETVKLGRRRLVKKSELDRLASGAIRPAAGQGRVHHA
jgi:excisionase family DNA binding protein